MHKWKTCRGDRRSPSSQHTRAASFKQDQSATKGDRQVAPTELIRCGITECGVTLVELIISMVIISIALVGVLSVMNFTTGRSADPMIQHQAIAIAEAYMEEILLQGYADPDGDDTGETRATFDDVDDYNSLPDMVVRDQNGNEISVLSSYEVRVEVSPPKDLGPTGKEVKAKEITVTVSHAAMDSIDLVGYRTEY
jgi:MSHA pilin protein MshD